MRDRDLEVMARNAFMQHGALHREKEASREVVGIEIHLEQKISLGVR